MKISHMFTATAAALAFAVVPATAGEHEPRKIEIDISGYDLQSQAGVDAVYIKIKAAAKRLCRVSGRPTVGEHVAMRKCMDESIVGAIERMKSPELKQAFATRARKSIG